MNFMPEIIIDEDFKSILPMLDKKTYALLEESLLEHGCMHPLVLWNSILIDGHNRYDICTKRDIPFKTVDMEFDSREAVVIWIISTQISRRNLNAIQLSYYRGQHYLSAKIIQGSINQFSNESESGQSDHRGSTANNLATQYKVSPKTIRRDAKVAEAINTIGSTSPEAKRNILSGEAGITRKHLNELLSGAEEDIAETVAKIEEGTFERKRPVGSVPEDRDSAAHVFVIFDPLHSAIIKLSNEFILDIQMLAGNSNGEGLKATIRSYIDALEDYYEQI